MSRLADAIRRSLVNGDIASVGPMLTDVWELHKRLHPDVTNERLQALFDTALEAGATVGRVCGAGGGGPGPARRHPRPRTADRPPRCSGRSFQTSPRRPPSQC